MIPKVIHYCWFGGNKKPEAVKRCINSWKKFCPEYTIVEWTEQNYDVSLHPYTKEAFEAKRWAFVSDFARLWIIYEYGGIYLDTDVELIKPLDIVLDNQYFLAIETVTNEYLGTVTSHVATGLGFGAEPKNEIVLSMLNEYNNVHFIKQDGSFDLTPCPIRNNNAIVKIGYRNNDELLNTCGGTIYPSEFFCPEDYGSDVKRYTENTISIHHYSATWKTRREKVENNMKSTIKKLIKMYRGGGN